MELKSYVFLKQSLRWVSESGFPRHRDQNLSQMEPGEPPSVEIFNSQVDTVLDNLL